MSINLNYLCRTISTRQKYAFISRIYIHSTIFNFLNVFSPSKHAWHWCNSYVRIRKSNSSAWIKMMFVCIFESECLRLRACVNVDAQKCFGLSHRWWIMIFDRANTCRAIIRSKHISYLNIAVYMYVCQYWRRIASRFIIGFLQEESHITNAYMHTHKW